MKNTVMRGLVLALLVCGVGMPAGAQTAPMTSQEQANLTLVLNWWREVLQAGHLELTSKYMAEGYIQHNINVPTGREGFVKFFSTFMNQEHWDAATKN